MNFKNLPILKNSLVALSLITWLIPVSSQAFPLKNIKNKKVTPQITSSQNNSFTSLFKPQGSSRPKYTVGGAVRSSSCFENWDKTQKMTALVPDIQQSITAKSHPELLAYIPPMDGRKTAMLVIRDSNEDYYHAQDVTIPAEGGIIKLNLSSNAPELEIDREYQWFLQVHCSTDKRIDDPIVEGQIKRVALNNVNSPMSDEELVHFYAKQEIWYDSVAFAYQLAENQDNNFYFQELIKSIGMEKLISESSTTP